MDATFHDKTARLMAAIDSSSMPDLMAALALGPPWPTPLGSPSPNTPLSDCVLREWPEGVDALLAAGFSPEEQSESGARPLHLAIINSRLDIADKLLAAGADLGARDHQGSDALNFAVSTPFQSAKAVAKLLALRPWPQEAGSFGKCALMAACKRNNLDAALLLIEAGFDFNFRGPHDDTPLSCAASSGNLQVLETLLERGAHPDGGWIPGATKTPLTQAIQAGRFACVQALVSAGARLWLPLADGTTAISSPVSNAYGRAAPIRDLLQERAALEESLALRAQIAKAPARAVKSGL